MNMLTLMKEHKGPGLWYLHMGKGTGAEGEVGQRGSSVKNFEQVHMMSRETGVHRFQVNKHEQILCVYLGKVHKKGLLICPLANKCMETPQPWAPSEQV